MSDKNKEYQKMNASEKTKYLGFKHFSDSELKAREKASEVRRVALFQQILEVFVAVPNKRVGRNVSEQELQAIYADPINNFYQWAVDNGYTGKDLKATVDNVIMISALLNRAFNQSVIEETCFHYAFTGENDLGDVPIKDLMNLAKMGMETRPDEPVIIDEEEEGAVNTTSETTVDNSKVAGEN